MTNFIQIFINFIKRIIKNNFYSGDEMHEIVYNQKNIRSEKGSLKEITPNQYIWEKSKDN